jgi:hypothetical protein
MMFAVLIVSLVVVIKTNRRSRLDEKDYRHKEVSSRRNHVIARRDFQQYSPSVSSNLLWLISRQLLLAATIRRVTIDLLASFSSFDSASDFANGSPDFAGDS